MTHSAHYKGLIFDFNGVLFWDGSIQRKSWHSFASQLREDPLTDGEIGLHVHGRNGKYTMEYLLGHSISQDQANDLIEQKEAIYRQMCLELGDLFSLSPGAVGLLDTLVTRQIPFTIATASGKRNVDFFITHLKLDAWFDLENIVYDDGILPGKPAPDFYLRAARNLGILPDACVVVEDSRSGIQAALNAGVGHIIALGPQTRHDELIQLQGVDQVLETLAEIQTHTLFTGH